MREIIRCTGYFTMLKYLVDEPSDELEGKLGYCPGSLSQGYRIGVPAEPLTFDAFKLRGSTRWSEGVLSEGPNVGRCIADLVAERSDMQVLLTRVAWFFRSPLNPGNCPAKVFPRVQPFSYPAGKVKGEPGGIPQFRAVKKIRWLIVADLPPGQRLSPGTLAAN